MTLAILSSASEEATMIPDERRMLTCEGGCNPRIHDYDRACRQWANSGSVNRDRDPALLEFITDASRRLVYTPHRLVRNWFWSINQRQWIRSWRCEECGSTRQF